MEEMLSPEALFVKKVLTTFWVVFAGVSVVADLNLIPGVSTILRSIAKRGKGDDDEEEEEDENDDVNDGDKKKQDRAAIAAAAAKKKKDDDADASSKKDETTKNEKKKKTTSKAASASAAWWVSNLFTVPHSWFAHFYAVGTAWNAALLFHVLSHADALTSPVNTHDARRMYSASSGALASVLFQIHVARRLVESVAVSKYRAGARMHVVGYLLGLVYYVAVPLTLLSPGALQAVLDCGTRAMDAVGDGVPLVGLGDGFVDFKGLQRWVAAAWQATPAAPPTATAAADLLQRLREVLRADGPGQSGVGTALFVMGNIHQNRYHRHLAALRGPGGDAVVNKGAAGAAAAGAAGAAGAASTSSSKVRKTYGVPRGGWFEAVSCPHYLAEVVLYVGLVVASGPNWADAAPMLAAVAANLALAARQNHAWYLKHMPDYPKDRYAMIPKIL